MTQGFDEDLAWFAAGEMFKCAARGIDISMSEATQIVEATLYPNKYTWLYPKKCTCGMNQGVCVRGTGDCMSGRLIED